MVVKKPKADFGGYATKNNIECSDGRTILAGAFKDQDKQIVPLVWSHKGNESPENILGHVMLENREDGVYSHAFFNDTPMGQIAKGVVSHGDIKSLSIKANQLIHKGRSVVHGVINEVSLVVMGANPGASIDFLELAHGDSVETLETEAIIYMDQDLEFEHADDTSEEIVEITPETSEETSVVEEPLGDEAEHADTQGATEVTDQKEKTAEDIYNSMTDEQKQLTDYLVGEALGESADTTTDNSVSHSQEEGTEVMTNVFEEAEKKKTATRSRKFLEHGVLEKLVSEADSRKGSFKQTILDYLEHADGDYGIEDIDLLFPDAKADGNGITYLQRRTEWVANVLDSVKHNPFSKVKSLSADITADEARAKGYVKGNLKKDEIIRMLKRTTSAKTVYKKQKLDRDDILDITEVDIVLWLKGEMRLMLDEEIAAAILFGDGREPDDEDKIDEDHIRPIAYDIDMYNTTLELDANPTVADIVDFVVRAQKNYKGTGTPTMYTTTDFLTDLILVKDTLGRRLYPTEVELAAALRVKEIITVEAMERQTDLACILVNLADYTVGADKGGEINTFDFFDIDFNQQKLLIETRISGALTKPKSAVTIIWNNGTEVTPNAPTFVPSTGVATIPSQTGVVYKNKDTSATLTAGAQTAIAAGTTLNVVATASAGYSFPHNFDADWAFTRPTS